MRHDKLKKEMYLLQLMTENRSYTVSRLCDKVGLSRRNFYYYLEFFRDFGLIVSKRGDFYSISRDSPFFGRLVDRISFTEEEAVLMRRLLDKTDRGNAIAAGLKKKLDRFYDFGILDDGEVREQVVRNISTLYEAIKLRRQVIIRGYSSPHSKTLKDRLVEPFTLLDGNNDVRCFEPASGLNKTFKMSRMKGVEMLDTDWRYADRHRTMYTDVFMFSGEERLPVKIMLGELSYNVMKEEYPQAEKYISEDGGGRHLLDMDVCSYAGIGRFVLGLFEDIEVLGGEGFKDYIREKIRKMAGFAAGPDS